MERAALLQHCLQGPPAVGNMQMKSGGDCLLQETPGEPETAGHSVREVGPGRVTAAGLLHEIQAPASEG